MMSKELEIIELTDYKPVLFYPIDPTPDYPINTCNILLTKEGNKKYMKIEDGTDVFENDMIVEFKFDPLKIKIGNGSL